MSRVEDGAVTKPLVSEISGKVVKLLGMECNTCGGVFECNKVWHLLGTGGLRKADAACMLGSEVLLCAAVSDCESVPDRSYIPSGGAMLPARCSLHVAPFSHVSLVERQTGAL